MKSLCLAAALFLLAASATGAAPLNYDVKKFTLKNGLTVLVLEDHSAPVVACQVWYKVGSMNERPGITGISHLFEHMMFRGSKNVGPEEHSRLIQKHGGTDNAFTYFDMTVYHETLPADQLELAVRLEAERQENLLISAENLASEREVVKEERRWRVDNSPVGALFEKVLNVAYTVHPYHWHIVGFMEDLDSIKLEDCQAYFKTHYAPNNAVVVVAGDVKSEAVMKLIRQYYDRLPAQPPPPEVTAKEPPQSAERRDSLRKIIQLEEFLVGYHIPELGHPDLYPLQVLARILFTGQSSRVYQRLVYKDQAALFVEGDVLTLKDPGLFYIIAGMQPGHSLDEGEKSVFEEVEKLKNSPVEQRELEKAKNQLEAQFFGGLNSVADQANQLGYYEAVAGDHKKLFGEVDKLRAVAAQDLMRVAKIYLTESNRTVVRLLPERPVPDNAKPGSN